MIFLEGKRDFRCCSEVVVEVVTEKNQESLAKICIKISFQLP